MRTLLLLALMAAGCGGDGTEDLREARQISPERREDAAVVARANNQFAFELFAAASEPGKNACMSPFSIATALSMLDAGAAGITDQELRAALHVSLVPERAHGAFGALLASLQVGRDHGVYTLATANRMFGQAGVPFLPAFLSTLRTSYGAELESVDFATQAEAARAKINQWVDGQTDHKISELLERDQLTSSTVLVLVNAILFKGTWLETFDRARTASQPFQLASGAAAEVPMMHGSLRIGSSTLPGARVAVLPFRGQDLAMAIVLPDEGTTLATLEGALDGPTLATHIEQASSQLTSDARPTEVSLPRFTVRSAFPLPGPLQRLGIVSAFDPGTADLSLITGSPGLSVDNVVHQAVITVDEEGAEAAAATAVIITDSAAEPFAVDRPFLYALYDRVTGSILFLGRVVDPNAG